MKQRAAIDDMASQKWDFVAIQAFGIGTLTEPVQKMIDAGIPVIDMDTLIAPLDQIDVHAFLAPDNEFMGAAVTQALVTAIGGKGKIVMTQGAWATPAPRAGPTDSRASSRNPRTSKCWTRSPPIGTCRRPRACGKPC